MSAHGDMAGSADSAAPGVVSRSGRAGDRLQAAWQNSVKVDGKAKLMKFCNDHPEHISAIDKFAFDVLLKKSMQAPRGSPSFGRGTTFLTQINKTWLASPILMWDPSWPAKLLESMAKSKPDEVGLLFAMGVNLEVTDRISDHFSRVKDEFVQEAAERYKEQGKRLQGMIDHFVESADGASISGCGWRQGGVYKLVCEGLAEGAEEPDGGRPCVAVKHVTGAEALCLFCFVFGVCACARKLVAIVFIMCVVTCAMSCDLSRFLVFGDLSQVSLESGLVTCDRTIDSNWSEQNATLKAPDGESTICLLKAFATRASSSQCPLGLARAFWRKLPS